MFIDPEFIREYSTSPGKDTFMIGRLVGLDGKVKNKPRVRLEHLAKLPQRAQHPRGFKQESSIIKMMSLGGYSGSPVFIYDNQWFCREIQAQVLRNKVALIGDITPRRYASTSTRPLAPKKN